MLFIYAQALALGFAIAMPVGPAGLFCMQRTLMLGRAAGLAAGLGIATADALTAALIAGGLSIAADFLVAQARPLMLAIGIILVGLGIAILWAPPVTQAIRLSSATRRWSFLTGFLLTIANPMAILMMGAALTLLGLIESDIGLVRAALLAAGVFSGSLLWWAILVTGVNTVQRQIPPAIVGWINRAAGLILVVLGVIAFGRGLI
jgi:threonine/homoserine/homoserine lactone efflux protein